MKTQHTQSNKTYTQRDESMQYVSYIYGRRAVAEALRAGKSIEKIFIEYSLKEDGIKDILSIARKEDIPVVKADKQKFSRLIEDSNAGSFSQGVIALGSAYTPLTLEEILDTSLAMAQEQSTYPLIVALDNINDPHNLGAIARSVACSGAQGILLPTHNTAPITAASIKTSAGALVHIPVGKVTNLAQALDQAKARGFWIIGTDTDATNTYTDSLYNCPVMIVIGNESTGIRPIIRKQCDAIVSIPLSGSIESLNASVAAGIILFEIKRQRSTSIK